MYCICNISMYKVGYTDTYLVRNFRMSELHWGNLWIHNWVWYNLHFECRLTFVAQCNIHFRMNALTWFWCSCSQSQQTSESDLDFNYKNKRDVKFLIFFNIFYFTNTIFLHFTISIVFNKFIWKQNINKQFSHQFEHFGLVLFFWIWVNQRMIELCMIFKQKSYAIYTEKICSETKKAVSIDLDR